MSSTSWVVPGYLVLLAVSLSACAQSPAISPAAVPAMAPANAPAIAPSQSQVLLPASELLPLPPAKRELTSQVLYQFLLAEIAGQRGELKLSAEAYADLAGRTRDARVAKRATEVSLYARQSALALQNARLWQELEPASPKALQTLSSLLVGNGRMAEARPFLQDWVKTGKGGEIFMQLHGLLARQKDKQAVLDLIADLAAAYPTVPEARFAVAQAAWHAGKGAKSLSELDETMRLKPGWSTAPLFKAQVLQQMQGDEAALAFMKEYLATTPGGREVRLAYAKQLARSARFADSRAQFEIMAQEMPDNPENYLAIGLIAMQTNDFDTAEASMTKALELRHPDEGSVRFHLGQLAEARGRPEQALTWYRSVTQGRQQLDAQLRAAVVMGKQGNIAQALEWLASLLPGDDAERIQIAQTEAQLMRDAKNYTGVIETLTKALEKMPDATDLLYDRAMAAEKVDRLDMLEADLRRLIKLKPDFAHAYNALGYTLADRTPRIKEAIELLDKALKLEPDDPFIQDSMGWALFKAKRYAESVELLRRAHASRPDPEIAAHLGEALWLNGDKDEARRIWQGSLQSHPENESLRETTSRLMALSRFHRWLVESASGLTLILILTACSHLPGGELDVAAVKLKLRSEPSAFRLEGRVSVKAGEESFSGSLVWRRDVAAEELLLRTPLGQGIAELRGGPAGMELKDAEGRRYFAGDADALVRQALGIELPLRGLVWWVVGLPRPGSVYQALPDAEGHLGELMQDGWKIHFSRYEERNGQPLPGKLVAQRGEELEVRLVADVWELP